MPAGLVVAKDVPHGPADGCHHVFIDAGSNKGVHGRFLFEPAKYPLAVKAIPVFDAQFGQDRQQSTCVFAFEPNLLHAEKQNHTEKIYRAMGWRYTYLPMALGARTSTLVMYRNKDYDNKGIQWSFGYRGVGSNDEAIEVPVLDFADWLERVVFSRRLPEDSPVGWGAPKVVVKMDIEGMEMRVLPRLLTSGTLCKINFIFGEAHYSFNPIEVQGNITLTETRDTVNWIKYLNMFLNASWCSPWHDLDDEDYLDDGLPYPEPPH